MKQEIVMQKGDSYCSRVKTRMAELVLGEASIQENYSKELEDGRRLKDWHYIITTK